MKGSIKQIEWAKNLIDIYRSRIKRFEESIPMEGSQIPVDQKDVVMAAINKTADEMENMDAEDVIALNYLINPFFDRTASVETNHREFVQRFNAIRRAEKAAKE